MDIVLIDNEMMKVTGIMENRLMVSRGFQDTKIQRHMVGATVTLQSLEDDDYINGNNNEVNTVYEVLRNRALEERFEDFEEMEFIELLEDVSNADSGNNVTTFVYIISDRYQKKKNLDSKGNHNDEKLLAYLINKLELIVKQNYSILYFHSASEDHQLEFTFLSKAYSIMSRDYKQNLQHLWIVHPTFWVKMAFFFCSPFMETTVATKVFVCESLKDLYVDFEKDGLPLPSEVIKNEEARNKSWF
eukprot:c8084_g1_i1.p1 GENE.c8084_g1_i1~~c8084_g1_i1.p1  ORF type:complete len:245 (-),score=65.30 c8084_g1_i1:62-796(-)